MADKMAGVRKMLCTVSYSSEKRMSDQAEKVVGNKQGRQQIVEVGRYLFHGGIINAQFKTRSQGSSPEQEPGQPEKPEDAGTQVAQPLVWTQSFDESGF